MGRKKESQPRRSDSRSRRFQRTARCKTKTGQYSSHNTKQKQRHALVKVADALASDGVVDAGRSPRSGPHGRVEIVDGRLREDADVLVAVERDAGREALELGELGVEVRRASRLRHAISGVGPAGACWSVPNFRARRTMQK